MSMSAVMGRVFRVLVYLFLLLPLLVVVLTAFSETDYIVFPPQGFTLKWFGEAISNRAFIASVKVSLILASVSTVVCVFLGTMVSLYFLKARGRGKDLLEIIFLSPVVVPTVVSAVAFLQFFSSLPVRGALIPLIIAHVVIQIAYVIRTVSASLHGLDPSFEEAALVLGSPPTRTLFKVTLPCAKRGIIAGAIFAFVVSFDEAVIVMFLSDSKTITYPLRLYSYISEHFDPMVSAFSTIFILLSFIVIVVVEKKIGLSNMY